MSNYPLFDPFVSPPFRRENNLSLGLVHQRRLHKPIKTDAAMGWKLSTFSGRFAEISGDLAAASLTLVFRLVLEAQKMRDPVAWITSRGSTFYPPDVADVGIDLSALAVIRAPDTLAVARAADHILRSGAFSLLVMDMGANAYLSLHGQARLAGLARKHGTSVLCITEKARNKPSLGSLIALRVHTTRRKGRGDCPEGSDLNSSGLSPHGRSNGVAQHFQCKAHVLKDKRRGPGRGYMEVYSGPDGLY